MISADRYIFFFFSPGWQQPPDRTKSWSASRGATGPVDATQTGLPGGSDPTTSAQGGAGRFRHAATCPAETVGSFKSAGHHIRAVTDAGISEVGHPCEKINKTDVVLKKMFSFISFSSNRDWVSGRQFCFRTRSPRPRLQPRRVPASQLLPRLLPKRHPREEKKKGLWQKLLLQAG